MVPHFCPTGTVLSASYEAKGLGVRTGTKTREALELCSGIQLRDTNQALYRAVHQQFVTLVTDICGSLGIRVRSIDEAAVFLSPSAQNFYAANVLALQIKERIRTEIGPKMRC